MLRSHGASHGTATNQKITHTIGQGSEAWRRALRSLGAAGLTFPATLSACITFTFCGAKKTLSTNTSALPKTCERESPTTTKAKIRPRLPIVPGIFKPTWLFRQRNRPCLLKNISNLVQVTRLPGDDYGRLPLLPTSSTPSVTTHNPLRLSSQVVQEREPDTPLLQLP